MLKSGRIPRVFLGTLVAALFGVAVHAHAATVLPTGTDCTTSPSDPNCFHLKGSDTLFDIMTTAINQARAAGVLGAKNLFYDGTGSGNAETQMKLGSATHLSVQSIGPMSRNMRPAIIDPASSGFQARDATHMTATGHAAWAPSCASGNVFGLDAAVVLTRGAGAGSACSNLIFGTEVNNGIPASSFKQAKTNNIGLLASFGDGSAFGKDNSTGSANPPTVNYSNLLMMILSGPDGSGTLKACSDPRRIQALQDLAGCMGVDHIEHIYRRDDNSGTTDTFKDRIMTVSSASDARYPWIGGRFCNGQSIGGINGSAAQQGRCSPGNAAAAACTTDAQCAGAPAPHKCMFNLNNQDMDPVRRNCVPASPNSAPTSCTDMTTGLACSADDNNPNCTQGLVVALSDTDPGPATVTDVTTSIAARVFNAVDGTVIGYAGREAVKAGRGTKGFKMNGLGFTDQNVRGDIYLLSRRLYLQNAVNPNDWSLFNVDPAARGAADLTNDAPDVLAGPSLNITGQGESQLEAEQSFFNWLNNLATGQVDHTTVDPIVTQFGFITCNTPGNDPCDPHFLCAKEPFAPAASALGAALPNGSLGTNGPGAKTITSTGTVSCPAAGVCLSDGSSCTSGGTCPGYVNRPQFAACTVNSDCAAGLTCQDVLGIGVPGQPISLLCAP